MAAVQGVFQFDQEVLEHVRQLTRRMLRRFPNVKRWDETDDITNLAAVRVWTALKKVDIESDGHFYRLVAKNIRWVLLDVARSHGGPEGIGANHETWHGAVSLDTTIASPSADLSRWTDFHEAVEKLTDDARDVFDLLWYSGLSHSEAAEVLGVSRRTLMYRWRSAKVQLAKGMNGEQPPTNNLDAEIIRSGRSTGNAN